MDQRRWEELNNDCLVKIFAKVGMESLLLDVPFVCKSWHSASQLPSCWKYLIFPAFNIPQFHLYDNKTKCWRDSTFFKRFVHQCRIDEYRFSITAFIKFVANRSRGYATSLSLPPSAGSEEGLRYIADVCPSIKVLSFPGWYTDDLKSRILPTLIGKWKNLESLSLEFCPIFLKKLVTEISIHCNGFCSLHLSYATMDEEIVMGISNLLPNLKCLILKHSRISKEDPVMLLRSCKELVVLDVSDCVGFDEEDDDILNLASHISHFRCKGSYSFTRSEF